jgi:thioesterase domain-containing protein
MERYNPLEAPASEEWLDLDESERIALVERYHRRARAVLPNLRAHATFHAIVENQAALGDETPVRRTLARLMKEGLDRHEAIHAVMATLSEHMFDLFRSASPPSDPNASYYAALEKLTIESWRKNYG